MHTNDANTTLRYVDASRLNSPAGDLADLDFRGFDDQRIGTLDGVVVEPETRRLRFFVVESSGSRRILLPADLPARIDTATKTLRVDVDPDDLAHCEEFDSADAPEHSDEDFIASLFHHRVA